MYVQQLYTSCLAEAAYYIECDGEAAIIDPIRETEPYIEMAKQRGTKIKYVFETHFHADFVSGHIDLAKKTGATIVYGPLAETNYKVHNAQDGEEFKIGSATIRALHTPGHTPESTCYLLLDENYSEYCIFTGDTLFVGDVGRPDLLDGKMTKEALAGMMYESLNKKIKPLADEIIVYPAHGPGSSCGKNLGKETWSTIGQQKKTNYALAEMSREQFIEAITEGLTPPPAYFFSDAMINKQGYENIDTVVEKNKKALSAAQVEDAVRNGAMILDTRNPEEFEKGFVKGSLNIGLNGMYAIWVGTLVDINQPLVLVTETGKEEESIVRLARVGYEKIAGYLTGGFAAWQKAGKPVDSLNSISPEEFAKRVNEHKGKVLDARKDNEYYAGHVKDAQHIPLDVLGNNLESIDKNAPVMVHCAGGYRSVIATSLLKQNGFTNVINVHGGWNKIKATNVPVEKGEPEAV